ncbi:MAG: NADH-quinone oxidoreductase subunit J [bacterium]
MMRALVLLPFYIVVVGGFLAAQRIFLSKGTRGKALWTVLLVVCSVSVVLILVFSAIDIPDLFLHLFTAAAILGGGMAITGRNPIHAILFMALNFLSIAGVYLMQRGEFIAVIQVSINTGAVVVMYLFIIMLIKFKVERGRIRTPRMWAFSSIFAGATLSVLLIGGVLKGNLHDVVVASVSQAPLDGSVEAVGNELYSYYLVPFEVAALILTVALIGAVIIGRREGD